MLTRALELGAGAGEAVLTRIVPWSDAAAQARGLQDTAHRPWPLAERPWVQGQTWRDLLFAHWPLPVNALRPVVPPELPVDTFHGHAWIAVTPFEVTGLRLRGTLPAPAVSSFPETNVRTYTTVGGRPGIFFISLDAGSTLAVAGARMTYRLPYFRARISIERRDGEIDYRCDRADRRASLHVRYRADGALFHPEPGTLEHFLTERYCLYTLDEHRRVHRAEIHHPPWPLQPARAEIEHNSMTVPAGVELPDEPPVLHYAARQDVLIWPLAPVHRRRA